jgi:hypothetical protein
VRGLEVMEAVALTHGGLARDLLGSGRPLLSGVSKHARLDLLEAKAYPSGDVMLRYARPNETWP